MHRLVPIALLTAASQLHAAELPGRSDRAAASDSDETLGEIVVFGRAERLIGTAEAASEGTVGGADLTVRPVSRVAELLEVVPGLIAAQHSGSGKANQYFLRGFNLDHGTDFTTYIDDVPMNLRTHGHGQGYLDVNGLIPEIVSRIDYRKGPYRADVGDFSLAGASFVSTVSGFEAPFLTVETGEYDWLRAVAGGTFDVGGGALSLAGQWRTYDGPWQRTEDLQHRSMWGKYARMTSLGALELSVSAYHATWLPTEQIPERAIGTSVCADEFCALDPTATGKTDRVIATARLSGDDWRGAFYVQRYDWHMSSNPTYDFQINQFDRRTTYGGRLQKEWSFASRWQLTAGTEGRYDDIGRVGVEHTDRGQFIAPISEQAVREGSIAAYCEATWRPLERLRVLGGLRADLYDFEVKALEAANESGDETDQRLSPKLGLAYSISDAVELYANWGRGFHSNDGRGVAAPPDDSEAVAGLVQGVGKEVGARVQLGSLTLTTTYWWLDVDSELKFVGDSNSVEPSTATQRRGYELVGFWRPIDWLAIDAAWTVSHARSKDSPDGAFVPGAVEDAGELGISAILPRWEASLRLRHLGAYALVEDNSLRAPPEDVLNFRLAWKPGQITVYGELLNVLNDDGKEIVYYYPTHVDGLDPPGEQVDGRVSRAGEPRMVRVGMKYAFK